MAAVATRTSDNSPHTSSSSMSPPKDAKRNNTKGGESSHAVQPPDPTTTDSNPPGPDAAIAPSNGQPLGPPPRPATSDTPDYFNQVHSQTVPSAYRSEPNPFEEQFNNSSSETPGKNLLPPVASLTSPQSLLPAGTPGWSSLRSGPLSPAMLAGPTNNNDYFGDTSFSRGFPTPNESSLRTGLTPGGGGSMFPAPSPQTQAIFNSLQAGGNTPGLSDFLRTATTANALGRAAQQNNLGGPTSQPADPTAQTTMDQKYQQGQQQPSSDPFGHPDTDAANGLYMLAQSNGIRNQFPVQGQPSALQTSVAQMGNVGTKSQETSPVTMTANQGSIGTVSGDNDDLSDSDESDEQTKPATRSRGKKGAASNRRKADDTPAKAPANKRAKNSSGKAADIFKSEDETSPKAEDSKDGRKMTDEEKRRNFLERNRVAALKCRQRKKQWLANLQAKVELFSTENDALSQTVAQLREEIVNLRSILLAHRDCPVAVQQGIAGAQMNTFLDGSHHNPYGMAAQPNGMPQGIPMQMPQGGPAGQLQRS